MGSAVHRAVSTRWAVTVAAAAALLAAAVPAASASTAPARPSANGISDSRAAASQPHWACPHGLCNAIVDPRPSTSAGLQSAVFNKKKPEGGGEEGGIDPEELRAAYAIPATGGAGQTIAVIEGFSYKKAEKDLAKYRSRYGLPSCTAANGCLTIVELRRQDAGQPRLHRMGTRGRARSRHGLGGVPGMPHHAGERRRRIVERARRRGELRGRPRRDRDLEQLRPAGRNVRLRMRGSRSRLEPPRHLRDGLLRRLRLRRRIRLRRIAELPGGPADRDGGRRHDAEESRGGARLQGESVGRTLARARHRQRLQRDLAEARLAERLRAAPDA